MSQVGKVGGHFTLVAPTLKSEGANAPSAPPVPPPLEEGEGRVRPPNENPAYTPLP